MWKSDNELFALMKTRLFTAVVGDILDTLAICTSLFLRQSSRWM